MCPFCGRIGLMRAACYASGARRMNGLEEVGARVRVDKLKPRDYSVRLPFPPNPRWPTDPTATHGNSVKALLGGPARQAGKFYVAGFGIVRVIGCHFSGFPENYRERLMRPAERGPRRALACAPEARTRLR
jgi:hypothetical protein